MKLRTLFSLAAVAALACISFFAPMDASLAMSRSVDAFVSTPVAMSDALFVERVVLGAVTGLVLVALFVAIARSERVARGVMSLAMAAVALVLFLIAPIVFMKRAEHPS